MGWNAASFSKSNLHTLFSWKHIALLLLLFELKVFECLAGHRVTYGTFIRLVHDTHWAPLVIVVV